MRTWLIVFLAIALLFILPKINTRRTRQRFPFLKRIDSSINVFVAVVFVIYLIAFVRWLLSR